MVKLELNLPWKPVLAWPWGVKYLVDPETYLVTAHEESWDIAPWEVRLLCDGISHQCARLVSLLFPFHSND